MSMTSTGGKKKIFFFFLCVNFKRNAPVDKTQLWQKLISKNLSSPEVSGMARVPFVPSTKIALKFTQITNHEQWTLPIIFVGRELLQTRDII